MTSTVEAGRLEVAALANSSPAPTTVARQAAHLSRPAASFQRPPRSADAMDHYYETTHANVHRGSTPLQRRPPASSDGAGGPQAGSSTRRGRTSRSCSRKERHRGAHLVAHSYAAPSPKGKAILLTELEHHANIVPWLMLAAESGPSSGTFRREDYRST